MESESRVDFTPLHQCLHIHDYLGKKALLKTIYDENRRLQADSIIKKDFNFHDNQLKSFYNYIENISGFFIIEAIVMESTREFRSRHSVESLWDISSLRIIQALSQNLQDCENPDLFLTIKLAIVSLIQTMEVYGYNISSLLDMMVSMLDTYAELMKNRCSKRLVEILDTDDLSPLVAHDQKEYDEFNLGYKYAPDKESAQASTNTLSNAGAPITIRGRGGQVFTKAVIKYIFNFLCIHS